MQTQFLFRALNLIARLFPAVRLTMFYAGILGEVHAKAGYLPSHPEVEDYIHLLEAWTGAGQAKIIQDHNRRQTQLQRELGKARAEEGIAQAKLSRVEGRRKSYSTETFYKLGHRFDRIKCRRLSLENQLTNSLPRLQNLCSGPYHRASMIYHRYESEYIRFRPGDEVRWPPKPEIVPSPV